MYETDPLDDSFATVFMENLLSGGSIVSSNDCSTAEIEKAREDGRFLVLSVNESGPFGYGFVYRPK